MEELLEDVLQALAVNVLTSAAFQCLARPSFEETPVVWMIVILLIVTFFVGLGNAVRSDARLPTPSIVFQRLPSPSNAFQPTPSVPF